LNAQKEAEEKKKAELESLKNKENMEIKDKEQ